MDNPKEQQVICPLCGVVLDCRDLNRVLSHEWDPVTGACKTIRLDKGSALKTGSYIELARNEKPINLN